MDSCDSHSRRRKHDEERVGKLSRTVLSSNGDMLSPLFAMGS